MNDFRCRSTERRSLTERIKEIIEKYERNQSAGCPANCPGNRADASGSKFLVQGQRRGSPCTRSFADDAQIVVPRASWKRFSCSGRSSSARNPPGSPKCRASSTGSNNLFARKACPSKSTNSCLKFSSLCDLSFEKKKLTPISCTNIQVPEIYPGPNLQRYLSSRGICPSLKGKLSLYENNKESSLCSPRTKASPLTTRRMSRCFQIPKDDNPRSTFLGNSRFPRQISSTCVSDDFQSANRCRCCPTNLHPINSPNSDHRQIICCSTEPPFSSPTLEREFTSRFVKVRFCS